MGAGKCVSLINGVRVVNCSVPNSSFRISLIVNRSELEISLILKNWQLIARAIYRRITGRFPWLCFSLDAWFSE